jgi:hypothetical protein
MYGLVYRVELLVSAEEEIVVPEILWDVGRCSSFQDGCLSNAQHISLPKPSFSVKQGLDIVHNKKMQPHKADEKTSNNKKKAMGWFTFVKEKQNVVFKK